MEGATCSSCAPDGSRESVKCQVRKKRVFLVGTINFNNNNLRGDNNINIAMNRMKAADITQLRYLFDMYLLCILLQKYY